MNPTSIRRATSADAESLSVFAATVFPLGCPETASSDLSAYIETELTPARFAAHLEDGNLIVLLAEAFGTEGRHIVAYMIIARRSPHPNLAAPAPSEFRKLYLDPTYHDTGLSSALFHCALSLLSAEGPRPIWLSVFSENPRAIAFYKKWGFEVVASQEFLVGTDRQKDFVMQRQAGLEPALCE
jgi:ribosomal protein S18 acetylase RimI-like enzyme